MSTEINHSEQQMNNEFTNVIFPIGREFATIAAARTEAFNFGKRFNVAFVTGRSDQARGNLTLTCKHFGGPRKSVSQKENEEKDTDENAVKKYHKDTQKLFCDCFIKFKRSATSQNLCVVDTQHQHTHPIPRSSTTYAVYRKQDEETKALIVKILSLSTSNAAEVIMTVSYIYKILIF
jgi:hypothetical protein